MTRRSKRQGRPPKLRDKKTRAKFLKEIGSGLSITQACLMIDVDPETYRNECRRDKEFKLEVKKARARFVASIIKATIRHANDDPATARHLAACFDKRFRKPETQSKSNHVHAHVHVGIDEQRSAIAAIAAKLGIADVFTSDFKPGSAAIGDEAVGGGAGLPAATGIEAAAHNSDAAAE